ncbi:hypothetical protein Hanom_Chr11g01054421 [Helianthus anomalus]
MLKRVAINLASTCDQEPCLDSFGESEHVHCANHICLVTTQVKETKSSSISKIKLHSP